MHLLFRKKNRLRSISEIETVLYGIIFFTRDTEFHTRLLHNIVTSFKLTSSFSLFRYWLECVLDLVEGGEQITKRAFTVISRTNLNTDPIAEVSELE